ncbi:hypothetical protein HDU87_004962 [Geranomyces variabilis]|uniref:Hepatocellular carcinoma-associated antigen 59-domain-containing protein n=1 Tax=Geranomyces variabilis TaxID=109894 RepID=A0AAD5THJ1_9FUNG|nr:hypothetical protein HDU87_004962 [Geranomyces variabilis]
MTTQQKKAKRQYRARRTLDDDTDDTHPPDSDRPDTSPSNDKDNDNDNDNTLGSVLQEALELRKYRRRAPGMDLHDLNRGDEQKRKKKRKDDEDGGGAGGGGGGDAEPNDDPWKLNSGGGLITADEVKGMSFGGAERGDGAGQAGGAGGGGGGLTSSGGFATESNAMDTERHMREFIEKEMRKRRGEVDGDGTSSAAGAQPAVLDPHDELFQIPDHLKTVEKPVSEGNVTLSTSMLTAIPEIDLGISSKLQNIEETEKAKRRLVERKAAAMAEKLLLGPGNEFAGATTVASERYWTGNKNHPRRDDDHRRDGSRQGDRGGTEEGGKKFDRRTMATDDIVMERFKKRIRRG